MSGSLWGFNGDPERAQYPNIGHRPMLTIYHAISEALQGRNIFVLFFTGLSSEELFRPFRARRFKVSKLTESKKK